MSFPLEHLTWLAALVDGEGCIGVRWDKASRTHVLRLRVSNSHRGLLEKIVERFGGHASRSNDQMWEWYLLNANAEELIRLIRPHLVIKRAQADLAIRLRETYGGYHAHSGKPVPLDVAAARDGLRQSLLALNRGQ